MKKNERVAKVTGVVYLVFNALLLLLQMVFFTLKIAGVISWSWWAVFSPVFCFFGLPAAVILVAFIVLLPKAVIEEERRSKRVDAEAAMYGMERRPGESTGDLKKRIVRRNMIAGNYSRRFIKNAILDAFPSVGSCQIIVDNQANSVVLIPRNTDLPEGTHRFTDNTLEKIAEYAAQYIPVNYTITAINAEDVKHDTEE